MFVMYHIKNRGREYEMGNIEKQRSREKLVYKSTERKFEKKVNRVFLMGLFISFLIVITMICYNEYLKNVVEYIVKFLKKDIDIVWCNLRENSSFLADVVWTLTTILAAFMVLHYSIIGVNTYGVQNRKIISYTCGTYYIPGIVIFNIFVVFGMTSAYYLNFYAIFYILALYSILLQLFVIIGSIALTSQRICFNVILSIEKKQYKELCENIFKYKDSNEEEMQWQDILIKNLLIYHVELILKSQNTLTEKFEITHEILKIPFYENSQDVFLCLHAVYYHFYQNMKHIVVYISENSNERQQFYATFYESIGQILNQYNEHKNNLIFRTKLLLYLGSLFHAIIPERRLEERWDFIFYILYTSKYIMNSNNKNLEESAEEDNCSLKEVVIVELFMSVYNLWRKGLIDLGKTEESSKIETFVYKALLQNEYNLINKIEIDLNKIKKELQKIVLAWIADESVTRLEKYEISCNVLTCMDKEGCNDYIYHLLNCGKREGNK